MTPDRVRRPRAGCLLAHRGMLHVPLYVDEHNHADALVLFAHLPASAMPEEVDAAGKAGALHYWTKPLDFAQFTQEMERLLGRR